MAKHSSSREEPFRYGVQIVPAARQFQRLPRVVQRILRLCDGSRSIKTIRRHSPLDSGMTDRVLERLLALGLIRDLAADAAWTAVPPEAPPVANPLNSRPVVRHDPALSADEAAFFAGGVEPLAEKEWAN